MGIFGTVEFNEGGDSEDSADWVRSSLGDGRLCTLKAAVLDGAVVFE